MACPAKSTCPKDPRRLLEEDTPGPAGTFFPPHMSAVTDALVQSLGCIVVLVVDILLERGEGMSKEPLLLSNPSCASGYNPNWRDGEKTESWSSLARSPDVCLEQANPCPFGFICGKVQKTFSRVVSDSRESVFRIVTGRILWDWTISHPLLQSLEVSGTQKCRKKCFVDEQRHLRAPAPGPVGMLSK